MRVRLLLLAMVAVVSSAGAARAQDFVGARALSLAEAYRANATGNDAIYVNPAGLLTVPRYSPEVHYQLDLVNEDHQIDVSVVDSKTSPFAAGIGYTFDGRQFTRRASFQHTATLAVAYPILDRLLAVGAGLKYVNVTDALVGNYLNALSADIGVMSRLPGGVSLAGVGYNLIPIRSTRVPLSAGFAANWDLGPLSALIFGGMPSLGLVQTAAGSPMMSSDPIGPLTNLQLEVDWYLNFATVYGIKSRLSTSVEYLLFDLVPLRAGYLWDEERDDHIVTVGAGFIVPYFGLDVGYQQSVVNLDTRTFSTSLKFFLPI